MPDATAVAVVCTVSVTLQEVASLDADNFNDVVDVVVLVVVSPRSLCDATRCVVFV